MAYSELIKSFDRIRDYMRDFYIYGFKRREEYHAKSARAYDNERRRIESWLGSYLSFRQNAAGKEVFISIDSRSITHNPLYQAFKAKTFTSKDILLHFYLLDALATGGEGTVAQLADRLVGAPPLDESTIRNKLKEYQALGMLHVEKRGKQMHYRLQENHVPLAAWQEAIAFFSEEDPLGVIGSYLRDRFVQETEHFRFKHHYILHALESEILYQLLLAVDEQRCVTLELFHTRDGRNSQQTVIPLFLYVSTQGGRRYLMARARQSHRVAFYRLDLIRAVKLLAVEEGYEQARAQAQQMQAHLWGVSVGKGSTLTHLEMTVYAAPEERHIPARLEREKRCGTVEPLGDGLYRFCADVYDARELLPWLRTFIGRICAFECSNPSIKETFLADLKKMERMYDIS